MGVSITIPAGITESDTITVDYQGVEAQRIFEQVSKRIGKVAEYDGSMITFSTVEDAQKDFVVIRSGYVDPEIIVNSIQSMFGTETNAEVLDDRIIITGDRRSLEQARELAKHFERGADGWLLSVRVVSVSKTFRRELGLDWNVEANLSLDTTGPGVVSDADMIVSIIGKATDSGTQAALLETASLYVLEGSTSTVRRGQRVPVPRFITSPYGSNSTAGFDYINAGFELSATARRVPGGVRLALTPKISSVIGFVREAPITQESLVEVQLVVQDGDWIIISGLDTSQASKDEQVLPGLPSPIFGATTDTTDESTLLVLVQARRVFSAE